MPLKTRFDISCEALDLYFFDQLPHLTPEAKDGLPRDVLFKIFRKGGDVNTKSTSRLSFMAKLFVLLRALNKRWWVVVEDENRGMTPGQFMDLRKASKKRDYTVEQAGNIVITGTMVLAGKELADTLSYLNHLNGSGAYNYLLKAKNSPTNRPTEWNKERAWVANFLSHYDGQKKSIVAQYGITIPEFYVLLTLFDGKDVLCSVIYKEKFKRAYQSTPSKIKLAFRTLQIRGFVIKTGVIRGATLRITPLGKDILNGIFDKYVLNW